METYIFIEGLLLETGTFELYRAIETSEVPISSPHFKGDEDITLILTDNNNDSLYHKKLPVVFNNGCNTGTKVISSASVKSSIPIMKGSKNLAIHFREKQVFAAQIDKSGPKLSNLEVKLSSGEAVLNFDSNAKPEAIQVFARLEDKRLLKPAQESKYKSILVDLKSISGQGEVKLIIEATKGFRTSRLESNAIETPPATAKGLIIEPMNESEWHHNKKGSLIASVFDENGRHLNWGQSGLFWKVNGKNLKDKRQMASWSPDRAGNYTIQLAKKNQHGKEEIESESNVVVLPPTEAQKEYDNLMKRMMTV